MLAISSNKSLKQYNTFGIDEPAQHFTVVSSADMLSEIGGLPYAKHILGGGSNVLLTKPVEGLVILNKISGITVEREDEDYVWVKAGSGEVWHNLVLLAINKGWAGIENLALIPGTVGASPMQNIGAYGVEVKETIEEVTAWHWKENRMITFANSECGFGYRDSVFKHQLKGEVFITSVTYRFNKIPKYNISYGAIEQQLEKMGVAELSIKAIAEAVITIRQSKLPDPAKIGNAGSFFKNPTIPVEQYQQLKIQYPDMPFYTVNSQLVKVPAGWLIEQCGWKGYRNDDYGVHAKQALVLVNYGTAKGDEIWALSENIIEGVTKKYQIVLEREVQAW